MDKLKDFYKKHQNKIVPVVVGGVALVVGIKIGKAQSLNVLNQSIDAGLLEVTDAGNEALQGANA